MKIYNIKADTNKLEFGFESNMLVRIYRGGNKVEITIVQGTDILMTIYDRSSNAKYVDWDGDFNLLFCVTKAHSVMQKYLELQD